MTEISFTINGEQVSVDADVRMMACDVIRDKLGLTGTHVGCEQGVCGACTILVDGVSRRSCLMYARQLHGKTVLTIEGLAPAVGELHPLQESFMKCHGLQCGFCTPGVLMSAYDLLSHHRGVAEPEVRAAMAGNLCRCTGYIGIVDAVLSADREWTR